MIVQNGRDITDEVMSKARRNAEFERRRTGSFREAVTHLLDAKTYLSDLPAPWQNDCIYNSIVAIEKIIKELQGE